MELSEIRLHLFGRSCHLMIDNRDGRGAELLDLCHEELLRLERKFSSYIPQSIISQINRNAGTEYCVPLDTEAQSLFQYVTALWEESKHIFDPTTRILLDCYGGNGELLASSGKLRDALGLVGWQAIQVTAEGAHMLSEGMLIDLNSCIRPYALDSLKKLLLRNGAGNAYIEIDHDVVTLGKQPDGANWLVGVRIPKRSRAAIVRLKLNNMGFAMRGDFEQTSTQNGEIYGRALSPVDGLPIPGLLCVAVIAPNCLTACSAVNVARFKTEATGLKWLDHLGFPWLAVDRQLNCHGPLARGI